MLSRVADSIYWMARYMERAENLARLLMANQNLMLDAGSRGQEEGNLWEPVLMTTGDEEGYHKLYSTMAGADVEDYLSVRPENSNSILNCIRTARENARMIRDQIPDEVWRSVNDLYLFMTCDKGEQLRQQVRMDYYEEVVRGSCLFQGVARATMMRDEGWQFLQIGTYLERADKATRLVDMCSDLPMKKDSQAIEHPLRWQSLLHSCSAYHGYREQDNEIDPRSVLEFLFLSDRFSRSVRFCMREVNRALGQLNPPPGNVGMPAPVRACGLLSAQLEYGTIDEILDHGVHEYIDDLQSKLNTLGLAIFETYVLYADLSPVGPTTSAPVIPLGAWHADQDAHSQQQQQQQQQ